MPTGPRRVGGARNISPVLPDPSTLSVFLDFDGTITMRDTLHVIVDEYGRAGVWDELEPDLVAGRITIEQAMAEQFRTVTATPDEIAALIRAQAGVRDGFADLVAFADQRGHRLVAMSAGFRSVIDLVLGDLYVGIDHDTIAESVSETRGAVLRTMVVAMLLATAASWLFGWVAMRPMRPLRAPDTRRTWAGEQCTPRHPVPSPPPTIRRRAGARGELEPRRTRVRSR